ncbi:MAG: radical SAM protein [Candidatus Aminicenantes bacterium]|nr:MAG: radical SAM protein [Candidatus Aminicenantes bacterium]
MKISNLTFIVTDDCNFNCTYCFQKKEKKTITNTTIETAVDFFYPFFNNNKIHIGFYGGEPLLAYEKIEHAVLLLLEKNKTGNKKIEFSVTTNGSLLTEKMLDFFNRHQFTLVLSFDGLAQDKGRKNNTLEKMVKLMKQIQSYPNIHFEINSVFSPQTITDFSGSMRFIIQQDGPEIKFNISTMEEWNQAHLDTLKKELERLSDFLVLYYKEKGTIPVKNFRFSGEKKGRKKGIFRCGAGRHRMSVTPGGEVWGCSLFHDYFKTREEDPQYRDYAFGTLAEFIANYETCYPRTLANYSELRQDYFQVEREKTDFCFLCQDVKECMVCPVNAAYSSGSLGKISCSKCQLIKIQENARSNFIRNLRG